MPKKSKPSQADINTFHEVVKDVKPLKHDKIPLAPATKAHKRIKHPSFKEEAFHLSESHTLPPVRGEEFISYKQAGVSHKALRKLRKGQYNVDAILDLHGMSIEEAKTSVDSFLRQCLHERVQIALIIHGKGLHSQSPVLKNKLNHWLRSINVILAFCSATSDHGSRGAIYVLLKRATKEISF